MSCTTTNNRGKCLSTYSSDCVIYQGVSFPDLDITSKDNLTEILEIILAGNESYADATGIDLSALEYSVSDIANRLVGVDKTLANVTQAIITEIGANKTILEAVVDIVETPISYTVGCLEPTENTTSGVLQAAVTKLCELDSDVSDLTDQLTGGTLNTTINNNIGNYLNTNVTSPGDYGLTKSGTGSSFSLSIGAQVPPFCPIPCRAPLSYWNADGTGKTGTPFEGWLICNGLNSTDDMRGFTFAGATSLPGISGVTLHSSVDPDAQADPTIATNIGDIKGEVKHQLTISELATHTHTGTADPHSHTIANMTDSIAAGESFQTFNTYTNNGAGVTTSTENVTFTTNSTGSSAKHENRQPTKYGYWIMRVL